MHALCAGDNRWMRPCWATRAGTQAPPLPNSIIFFHTIPHKQKNHLCATHPNGANHPRAICPNEINRPRAIPQTTLTVPHTIHPNGANHPHTIYPNEIVGAVPVCPPERPRSGVSIPKIHALCAGILTTDAPLWGDTGGHTGTAPTNLHQTLRCAIIHCTFDSPRQSHGVPITPSGLYFR